PRPARRVVSRGDGDISGAGRRGAGSSSVTTWARSMRVSTSRLWLWYGSTGTGASSVGDGRVVMASPACHRVTTSYSQYPVAFAYEAGERSNGVGRGGGHNPVVLALGIGGDLRTVQRPRSTH